MNRKNGEYPVLQKFPPRASGRAHTRSAAPFRRPLWLPASGYYVLAAVAAIAFFCFVWAIFHEGSNDAPWVAAGVGAAFVLVASVVLREVFLRRAREKYLLAERKLDYNLKNLPLPRAAREEHKISLEENAALVKNIEKKSEAARLLGKIASGHLEVFELCGEYIALAEKQLETAGVGSPRLAGLRRGREIVGELRRYHLLTWAEIESRQLTQKAKNYATISEKINAAQEALAVLDRALQFYPHEPELTESEAALKVFVSSIKVSHWIEQAERAAFKGNRKRAISLYRDALFFLARENAPSVESERIAAKINREIETLRALPPGGEPNKSKEVSDN